MANKFFDKVGTNVSERVSELNSTTSDAPASPSPLNGHEKGIFKPDNITDESESAERRWAVNDNVFWTAKRTLKGLPSGLYRCGLSQDIGAFLIKIKYDIDNLIVLPDSPGEEIIAEIRKFWEIEEEFTKRGFTHKRGVLLWGPPGSGKTSTIQLLIELIVKQHNGLGIYIDNPSSAIECLQMLRRAEPGRHIIGLMEDMDTLVQKYGESEYLSLLDGENQIGNIVYVGTTNYPEKLDRRFVDRPSRFDTIKHIDYPSSAERRAYLLNKEPTLLEDDVIRDWVKATDGLSIAHLKELIILVKCYGHTLAEAAQRLNDMHNAKAGAPGKSANKVGFR